MNKIKYLKNKYISEITPTELQVLNKIIESNINFKALTIKKLADKCYTSTATIHRLVKKIGYSGFVEFKLDMVQEQKIEENNKYHNAISNIDFHDTIIDELNLTFDINRLNLLPIAKAIHNASSIYCYGTGWKQTEIVYNFASDLTLLGYHTHTFRTSHDIQGAVSNIDPAAVIIIVSLSGQSTDLKKIISALNYNNIPIISVTENKPNFLASQSKYTLFYSNDETFSSTNIWTGIPLIYLLHLLLNLIESI